MRPPSLVAGGKSHSQPPVGLGKRPRNDRRFFAGSANLEIERPLANLLYQAAEDYLGTNKILSINLVVST
jgi:hypothetical protein